MPHPKEKEWIAYAKKHLVGRRITSVRYMTDEEAEGSWSARPVVFQLDDGSIFFPSADDEGNNGGALFGQAADGEELLMPVLY